MQYFLTDPIELDFEGIPLLSKDIWMVNSDRKTVAFYHNRKMIKIDISDFNLNHDLSNIIYIDFIKSNEIFVFVEHQNNPKIFLKIIISENEIISEGISEMTQPKTLCFSLNSFFFHENILTVFVPHLGAFVILSQSGISYHDINFQMIYYSMQTVKKYIVKESYLYVEYDDCYQVLRFNNNYSVDIVVALNRPIFDMLIFRSYLLLIYHKKDSLHPKKCYSYQKVPLDQANQAQDSSSLLTLKLQHAKYRFYTIDNALFAITTVITKSITENTISQAYLIDFDEDEYIKIGRHSRIFPPDCINIHKNYCICEFRKSKNILIGKLRLDYSKISLDRIKKPLSLISALFRRSDALNYAISHLRNFLITKFDTIDKLLTLLFDKPNLTTDEMTIFPEKTLSNDSKDENNFKKLDYLNRTKKARKIDYDIMSKCDKLLAKINNDDNFLEKITTIEGLIEDLRSTLDVIEKKYEKRKRGIDKSEDNSSDEFKALENKTESFKLLNHQLIVFVVETVGKFVSEPSAQIRFINMFKYLPKISEALFCEAFLKFIVVLDAHDIRIVEELSLAYSEAIQNEDTYEKLKETVVTLQRLNDNFCETVLKMRKKKN
ncbi:hypothetical protein TRFO_28861 [Tritrichomonas foetus]|uniref:Uncharacterized protein n=1 Tax=Tritrichomonas foetus TaxID=1144522 RepID=A0A1J4JWZ5_9EUKA|nr:hypothetical protein TRFO_28861 [Tritrichomonas foetus]|eukprot:OHT03671.1 hypothetical protein TRFO_28861 [Tritrichomonas foetus]